METLKNKTVFKCSYCTKVSLSSVGIYQHERFCRKNPHNHILCFSCVHCQREEHLSEEGEKCEICPFSNYIYGDCSYCDSRIKYTDFICDIDGSKMYSKNRIRRKQAFENIKNRCDRPMVDETMECKNYECRFDY